MPVQVDQNGITVTAPDFVPRDGEYCRAYGVGSELDLESVRQEGSGETKWVINDSSIDRHGTIIPPENLDLSNYRESPVVFTDHWPMAENLIGNSTVTLEEGRLIATMLDGDFSDGGDWSLQREVKRDVYHSVKHGKLRGASIGFRGIWEQVDDDEERGHLMRLKEGELVEWSMIGVPSNPGALLTERSFARMGYDVKDKPIVMPVTRDVAAMERTQRRLGTAVAAAVATAITHRRLTAPTG